MNFYVCFYGVGVGGPSVCGGGRGNGDISKGWNSP